MFFIFMAHYFKMNSYSKTNRGYHTSKNSSNISKWEEDSSAHSESDMDTPSIKYPKNLTLKNFWQFLLHPTFCYEANYPLSKFWPNPRYLILKLFILAISLLAIQVVFTSKWVPIIEAMKYGNQF